jgi:ribonuclease HI
MFFDGASSNEGDGSRVVFISRTQEIISLSYKLEFQTTNNVAEYEALVLGLRVAKDMKIEELAVFGDSELIVHQVKNMYQAKHPKLRTYKNEVWDLADNFFLAFNISFVPREENIMENSLAVSASNFKVPFPPKIKYDVEVKYIPSIPDNFKHWKVFEDDLEIKRFLETVEEFSSLHIDEDHDDAKFPHADIFLNKFADHHIVQLPINHIPKGLVPLERLFDKNDVAVKVKGTEENPKYVKLSSSLSKEQRAEYVKLLKEFTDVFSWKYEYLQTYDTSIIEHNIPLKDKTKPFRPKLIQINPMLLPIMEKELKKLLNAKIIIPLRYSEWVANLVPVKKNNGEIRLCVDFINLNKNSKKDNYPLPNMEHIL